MNETLDSERSVSAAAHFLEAQECRKREKPMVTFGVINIREYNQVVGDHPDVTSGPPVALGWDFAEKLSLSVDSYEIARQKNPRTTTRLSGIDRKNMLLYQFGIPEEEVRSAEKEVQRIRSQHDIATRKPQPVHTRAESKLRKLRRKIAKNILPSLAASAKFMAPPMMVM